METPDTAPKKVYKKKASPEAEVATITEVVEVIPPRIAAAKKIAHTHLVAECPGELYRYFNLKDTPTNREKIIRMLGGSDKVLFFWNDKLDS